MTLNRKQFNMVEGPQGYTGPDGPSEERRLGKRYVEDMAALDRGEDTSYFPGQGTSQGKFFHDPKPHDAVRFQRGYTPERQQVVHDMIVQPKRPERGKPYAENPQAQNRYTEAEYEALQDRNLATNRQRYADSQQVRAEFVDHIARSDAPNEDLARLRHQPETVEQRATGITVSRMPEEEQRARDGQILYGREIQMPAPSQNTSKPVRRAIVAVHELGHALDHVDRRASGRPDYNDNSAHLRGGEGERKTEAVRDLGRMEGAADVYAHRYTRGPLGGRPNLPEADYPTKHYSESYGSDRAIRGGRNARMSYKFTPEESKAFKGGYQEVHKAEGVPSPSKREKAKGKANAARHEATMAAWGEHGKPAPLPGRHPSPQLQWQEDEHAAEPFSEERAAIRKRNTERRINWG